jgi:hypothetical protein
MKFLAHLVPGSHATRRIIMAALLSKISKPAAAKIVATPFLRDSPTQPLTGHDRCDCSALEGDDAGNRRVGSCGAQARVRVTLRTGSQILFCGHHYGQHGVKIAKPATVHDEREQASAPAFANEDRSANPVVLRELSS